MHLLDRVRDLRRARRDADPGPTTHQATGRDGGQAAGPVTDPPPEREDGGVRPSSPAQADAIARELPGGRAQTPAEIPRAGWVQVVRRGWREAQQDQVPLIAAGVAFYAFLSIVPAVTALVLLYGLVADPSQVQGQVDALGPAVPGSARQLLTDQMSSLASSSSRRLGVGLVVSVLVALWSASNGAGHLITAVNIAYDETETRGFVRRKALALLVTAGAIVVVVVALGLIAVLPHVMDAVGLSGAARFGVQVARWALLLVIMAAALAVVYRVAPDRNPPRWTWVSVGAAAATLLWLLVSVGFTVYADVARYGSSYGSLGGVVVLLVWLWLTAYAVLLGAEVNAESELQTVRDTTTGDPRPIGVRDAVKADTLPG